MVRMNQGILNKRVFDRILEYKSVGGCAKQMREETERLNIIKILVENKEKRKGTARSKERQAEMMRRYWDKRKAKMRKEK